MNKKKTNYLVLILNVVVVIFTYIFKFAGGEILNPCFMIVNQELKSIYDNKIMDLIVNNLSLIMIVIHSMLAVFNIICAIQNKKDKKICFWQVLFGLYEIYYVGYLTDVLDSYILARWENIIVFGLIPIILAIRNFICIRKNKATKIKIISYIATIIIAVLTIFNVFNMLTIWGIHWEFIILIMLFIYIHKQDNVQEESKIRKIVNIILYYILQFISVVLLFISLIFLIVVTKTHETKWKDDTIMIYNEIVKLHEITDEELYMPVEKNGKYGFINEKGEEKIKCEYDRVTYFIKATIDNKDCYFALVEQNQKYYIISKSNDKIDIEQQYYYYLKSFDNKFKEAVNDFGGGIYSTYFSYALIAFGQVNENVEYNMEDMQQLLLENENNIIELISNASYSLETDQDEFYYENEYVYNNEKFVLKVKAIANGDDEDKFEVNIKKRNGEEITTIEYLPQANYYNYLNTIKISTYSDGSIGFESLDGKIKGFYDADGNKISFRRKTDNYEIEDVKDDKVIIDIYEEQKQEDGFWTNVSRYYIYDKKGEFYLKANKIEYIKDMYLIIDEDNKMALYDKNLNKISNQYNRILPNGNLEFELSYI